MRDGGPHRGDLRPEEVLYRALDVDLVGAGRRSDWKKAYVRLRDGEKLPEFLEGA